MQKQKNGNAAIFRMPYLLFAARALVHGARRNPLFIFNGGKWVLQDWRHAAALQDCGVSRCSRYVSLTRAYFCAQYRILCS